jgi:hypothetical protein
LTECNHENRPEDDNCSVGENVWVTCWDDEEHYEEVDGLVELHDAYYESDDSVIGLLVMSYANEWGTVCDDIVDSLYGEELSFWDALANDLGYDRCEKHDGDAYNNYDSHYDEEGNEMTIVYDGSSLDCTDAYYVEECVLEMTSLDCGHSEDVYVHCYYEDMDSNWVGEVSLTDIEFNEDG